MENLNFVVYWMNAGFWDEIVFSAYKNDFDARSVKEWQDYLAMMCGL